MKRSEEVVMTRHARARTNERQIDRKLIRAVSREASRHGLAENLEAQHKKFASMLTEKDIHARVGCVEYRATSYDISTRLTVEGTTIVVGIRKDGQGYTPLTVATVWN